ncbi:BA75_01176T0 [Komagataella pastoris]|uniref:BA75_01176T0 n=1 Tax=Komagataella pastoris TaxID=4922 RepID=A0A1B2J548_PICPA|nr:BA75_01176T0 [Komagataella pastoris]
MSYSLKPTLDRDLVARCQYLSAENWKGALKKDDDYIQREVVAYNTRLFNGFRRIDQWNRDSLNGITFWVLQDENGEIVSSCETLVRPSYVIRGKGNGKSEVIESVSPCFASVYTPHAFRGKGQATKMLKGVVERLEEVYKADPDVFIALYSEVGRFYEKLGFTFFEVDTLKVYAGVQDQIVVDQEEKYSVVKVTKSEECNEIVSHYDSLVLNDARERCSKDQNTRVLYKPTVDILEWMFTRAGFIGSKANGKEIEYQFGVKILENDKTVGYVTWTYDHLEKSLDVLFIHFDNVNILKLLIKEALLVLKALHYDHISIWESQFFDHIYPVSAKQIEQLLKSINAERGFKNSSLSAAKFFKGEKFIWEENTKWPWF